MCTVPHFLAFLFQLPLVCVIGVSGKSGKAHALSIIQTSTKICAMLSDNLFCRHTLFCNQLCAFDHSDLLTIQPGGLHALSGSLVQVLNFLFGLFKRFTDLLFCQQLNHSVCGFNVYIGYLIACGSYGLRYSGLVCVGINIPLFDKYKVYALVHQLKVCFDSLVCVPAHAAN